MKRAEKLPKHLRDHVFTTAEGTAAGLTPMRMRGADLAKPFHGIRAPGGREATPAALIVAYNRRMSPDHFFSHVTAALIHGLPLPLALQRSTTLHVCTGDPAIRHGSSDVVGHHCDLGSIRVVLVHGFRVTSPVDTWCQLSTVLSLDDLIKVGDALVRRKNPLATMAQLGAAVLGHSGRRGAKKLREAFEWVRPGVDSPKETELRLLVVRAGLPEPEVNGAITNRFGAEFTHGDLVYRQYRVVVEYDGEQHRTDEDQYHWDVDRLDELMEENWRVVRINKSHLRSRRPAAVRKIETALRAAGWCP